MRIAVVGVGAVGGYFGGCLAEAGHDVVFVARGGTLDRLRKDGLQVESGHGDFSIPNPQAVGDPSEAGQVVLILLAVKAPQIREAGRSLAPLVGPDTAVIPLENGVEAPSLLAEILGPKHILGGLCRIFSTRVAPARIRHDGLEPTLLFGELGRENTDRVHQIRAALESTKGMTVTTPDDVKAALWEKFLFVAPLGGVGALVREPAGVFRAVPETRAILRAAMDEIVAVGQKRDIAIGPDATERALRLVDALPHDATASMQRDIVEGRPSELEYQTGTVVRYGQESAVPTPVNSTIYGALLPSELRATGRLASSVESEG